MLRTPPFGPCTRRSHVDSVRHQCTRLRENLIVMQLGAEQTRFTYRGDTSTQCRENGLSKPLCEWPLKSQKCHVRGRQRWIFARQNHEKKIKSKKITTSVHHSGWLFTRSTSPPSVLQHMWCGNNDHPSNAIHRNGGSASP